MAKYKSLLNWSGGKDSALALHHILKNKEFKVQKLLTSVNKHHERVSMHGVRINLLIEQANSIGIPLSTILLPEQPSMADYEDILATKMSSLKEEGFTHSIFGDIFLEDLKTYREEKLKLSGFNGVFPLWKKDSREVIQEFISLGFKSIIVCVKADLLDKSFVGREINQSLLNDLPKNVDPCGEYGEFHTFCFDGPIFKKKVQFQIGEKIFREYEKPKKDDDSCGGTLDNKDSMGFWFCDLIPIK